MKLLDGVTKALTLHQPYATLIAAGIKEWETRYNPPGGPMCPAGTRPLPGLPVAPGERIAVHAAITVDSLMDLTGIDYSPSDWQRSGFVDDIELLRDATGDWGVLLSDDDDEVTPFPFGAIVGTAIVAEVLPMCAWWCNHHDRHILVDGGCAALVADGAKEYLPDVQFECGYWAPRRWAWRMTDPVMFDAPILFRGAQGIWRVPTGVAS